MLRRHNVRSRDKDGSPQKTSRLAEEHFTDRRNLLPDSLPMSSTRHPTIPKQRATRRKTRPSADQASTHDRILEAAYRTLVDLGYNQVSMRRIAIEAGVNQSLLHYYFGSKEHLMIEVLAYVNDQLLARQRKMFAEAESFAAIWEQALEYFKEDVRSGYVRALWELWAQGLSNPRIKKRWIEITRHWYDLLLQLTRRGMKEYGIESRYDPHVLTEIFRCAYWGAEVEILTGRQANAAVYFEALRLTGTMLRLLAVEARKRVDETASGDS
jgi:AcrR family transcriptional regulator